MAVLQAFYQQHDGDDLHLVPGMDSPRLDQRLFIQFPGDVILRADSPDLVATTVTFSARLQAGVNHGVDLDANTGVLHMTGPPMPGLSSFVVTASVTDGGPPVTVPLRVHVHPGISQVWLRPDPLTLRLGAAGVRPSLMARFPDGVIGDVTNWGPNFPVAGADRTFARLAGTADPWLRWSASGGGTPVAVDPKTGVLTTAAAAVAGAQGVITAQCGVGADPTRTATATVRCAPAWATAVRLEPVGPHTRFDKVAERTNVLLLPDGFVDDPVNPANSEKAKFQKIATDLVAQLHTDRHTRPFDLLKKQVNYFTAWIASPKQGTSILNEVRHGGAPADEGTHVPLPSADPGPGPVWSLEKLIDEVGLPAPLRDLPGTPLGTPAAGRLHDWQARFGPQISPVTVSPALHDQWLALGDRALVDEVDTAFHMAFSSRPNLARPDVERTLSFNPRRVTDADFDLFLDALQNPAGVALRRWSIGAPDENNVVVICRTRRWGGGNGIRRTPPRPTTNAKLIAAAIDGDSSHRLVTTAPSVSIQAFALPAKTSTESWLFVAHEVAHSWTIEDEYSGVQPLDAARTTVVDAAANVQIRARLLVNVPPPPPPAPPPPQTLDSTAIKWQWPRVEHCGVLAAPPERVPPPAIPVPAQAYRLKLRRGEAVGPRRRAPFFKAGDIVRLRTRPLLTSTTSDQVLVTHVDPATDTVTVEKVPGHVLPDLTPFGTPARNESIVIKPLREPDPNLAAGQLGPDLGLVSKTVLTWIHTHHNPLNAAVGAVHDRPWDKTIDRDQPTRAPDFVPLATRPHGRPLFTSWIVGLFEDGANAPQDVYRPTGICLMRSSFIARFRAAGDLIATKEQAYEFCPVCRYVMVDTVDPSQHRAINIDYEARYLR